MASIQRIKLRMYKHPVKLDATLLEMSEDGKKMKVRFDGPLGDLVLYRWSETILVTRELKEGEVPGLFKVSECQLWEVV